MNASLFALPVALLLCTALCAQPMPVPSTTMARHPPRIMDSTTRSNMIAHAGGIVEAQSSGPTILFLNTQTRLASAQIKETPDQIKTILRLPVVFKNQPSQESISDALQALTDTNIAAVIVIGDSTGYPSLLVAPESRWVFVNVAALSGPNVSDATFAQRVQKETWRAFGYLMGAANSNFEPCLMKSVTKPTDLDALTAKILSPEPFAKIMDYAKKLGLKPVRMATYRKAAEEGWAPAPVTDIQRAIWSELKK